MDAVLFVAVKVSAGSHIVKAFLWPAAVESEIKVAVEEVVEETDRK